MNKPTLVSTFLLKVFSIFGEQNKKKRATLFLFFFLSDVLCEAL